MNETEEILRKISVDIGELKTRQEASEQTLEKLTKLMEVVVRLEIQQSLYKDDIADLKSKTDAIDKEFKRIFNTGKGIWMVASFLWVIFGGMISAVVFWFVSEVVDMRDSLKTVERTEIQATVKPGK